MLAKATVSEGLRPARPSSGTAPLLSTCGAYADRILRGEPPANLPVEQPTKFELTVNLNAAKALRIEVASSILLRADKVIE
jgi:putative ABC transport system substrate-binding protein